MSFKPILQLDNVNKVFPLGARGLFGKHRSLHAVQDVSFDLEEGKTLAIVGESGCGKTTTAMMILQLEKPTSGRILLDGKDIANLAGKEMRQYRKHVQAVFQDPWASLNPRQRIRSIVSEPLVVNEKVTAAQRDKRVDEVLEAVGIGAKEASKYPHEFSGGQRQRIAIASALISNPRVIILDEPVSALDVSIRAQIMNLFKDLQDQYNVSYVLVAHDLGTTRYMADALAVMYLGRFVEIGKSEDVLTNALHPYTEALLSAALPVSPYADHNVVVLTGEVPSPVSPPSGCPFHPRCHKKIGEICECERPVLKPHQESGHQVACHLYT